MPISLKNISKGQHHLLHCGSNHLDVSHEKVVMKISKQVMEVVLFKLQAWACNLAGNVSTVTVFCETWEITQTSYFAEQLWRAILVHCNCH